MLKAIHPDREMMIGGIGEGVKEGEPENEGQAAGFPKWAFAQELV